MYETKKQVTKSEDLCEILFLWKLEVCLVSRFLNPKSVFEARSQWKFSRADIAASECRQWKVRQTGIWTGRGAAVLSVQKISSIDLGGNFQRLHHG